MQEIFIEEKGKGFPLVLIHGFLGSSKMWKPQIDFFKDDFRVIAPDLPGFGKSKNVTSHNSISSIADTILENLKNLFQSEIHYSKNYHNQTRYHLNT